MRVGDLVFVKAGIQLFSDKLGTENAMVTSYWCMGFAIVLDISTFKNESREFFEVMLGTGDGGYGWCFSDHLEIMRVTL